ncbi:hypothetical protein MAXJ12_04419 [Mesorhizobium alhagi CCNWXJ12-2]|jgi:hypothetical protein|uniref:Uncharacterized protein n=2 Tax=Allomesorhizobium alhagi TaxID=475067 RepID=H0HL73_9HYPH|nr:hypothetical protein MAXJ12_04419 [Mesorhizobium alhagi CCNWXJ12-2]
MTIMTKSLLLAAVLGLSTSGAFACEFQRSAKVDKTVVASVATPAPEQSMSTPAPVVVPEQPAIEQGAE